MKKQILIALFSGLSVLAFAQEANNRPVAIQDTISLGYGLKVLKAQSSVSSITIRGEAFQQSPEIDITKALYGKIAGLNVYQGSGSSATNISSLSIHGHSPLVLIDGFPRNIADITANEIESISVLKDAVASAIYGVRGANGVVLIITKRASRGKLKITANYQFGINTQFRAPDFSDGFTYAQSLNSALTLDNLDPRYSTMEMNALETNRFPNEYANVNWWDEVYNKVAFNHRVGLTFEGGTKKFLYNTVIDYMHGESLLNSDTPDNRYDIAPTDIRLNLRSNIDVVITPTTKMKLGLAVKLMETNGANFGNNNLNAILYNTPAAAFPIKNRDGVYGGNSIYGAKNPVALLTESGQMRRTDAKLLANVTFIQDLDVVTDGLYAEASVAFDNVGSMYDASSKTYRYEDAGSVILNDGTLVTTPIISGKDSEILNHSQNFRSLYMESSVRAKLGYDFKQGVHDLSLNVIYDQQGYTTNGRNKSISRQSVMGTVAYTYDQRYSLSGVLNYSGSSYLEDGNRFTSYPAFSVGWIASNEDFMKSIKAINYLKFYGSYGTSGWDGNLSHELYLQSYGNQNAREYYFTNNATPFWGQAEGNLPVENLSAEKSLKTTFGVDLTMFNNKLSANVEAFYEKRTQILISSSSTVSSIIGIGIGSQCNGEQEYKGFDTSLTWSDTKGDFAYEIGATASYLDSKIINEGQAYQQYDYLYHKENRVGQRYGLEAIGFFRNQMEINNSPIQNFSTVCPGDIKYKDQNGDNKIDNEDVVKMFGSSIPRFYFGFNLAAAYKQFEISANFQGLTGKTVNLLSSPLYKPLLNNSNISDTFLDRETPWTPENATSATMPRLTSMANANNYRNSSLWYEDGSFIKLRNLMIAYTIPKHLLGFADMKVYVQGTNLFSLDNLKFTDPEQLGASYPSVRSYWAGLKFNF